MIGNRAAVLLAVGLAGGLALLFSVIGFALTLAGVDSLTRVLAAPSPLQWPFFGRPQPSALVAFALGLVVVLAIVALVSWLSTRRTPVGFWPTLFAVWFGTVVAGWFGGLISGIRILTLYPAGSMPAAARLGPLLSSINLGVSWGLGCGWIVGLGAGLLAIRAGRAQPAAPSAGPGSSPPRSTPWPPQDPGSGRPGWSG